MVPQLKDIAGQIRSKVDDVLTNMKKNALSTPLDPDDQGTSSCSPDGVQPNDSERASKLIDSVVSTLFSACTGNNCPTRDEAMIVESMRRKQPTKIGKKARSALHTLQNSSSRDECHYAQFYEDDHGMAARAVLMARKREDRERSHHLLKLKELHKIAKVEALSKGMHSNKTQKPISPQPRHRENIHVDGDPYRLCEVGNGLNQSTASDDTASALSYNYDDGISAISANTLEEMAKAELLLQRKYGVPEEEGFDFIKMQENLPPSPTSTVESSNDGNDLSHDKEDSSKSELVSRGKELCADDVDNDKCYPIQMARPRSHRSVATTGSSTQSDFLEWKNQDHKYWAQVSENEVREEGVESKITSTAAGHDHHPHEKSVVSTRSAHRRKKDRKMRTPKLFGRRKKNYWNEIPNEYDI